MINIINYLKKLLDKFADSQDKYWLAQKFWLLYDYKTEIYDRKLPGATKGKYDKSSAMPYFRDNIKKSNENAKFWQAYINYLAVENGVGPGILSKAKVDSFRTSASAQERIDTYLKLRNNGELDFVHKHLLIDRDDAVDTGTS